MSGEPKKHHYVPSCYSKNFANEDGYIFMNDLWDDCRCFANLPENALKSGYMYSQPVHAEKRFDNAIEIGFGKTIENDWGPIVKRLFHQLAINQTDWGNIVQFIAAQHTRVPNCFDAVINLLIQKVVNASENLSTESTPDSILDLYRKFTGDENSNPRTLSDLIKAKITKINIDEHCCITSMPHLVKSIPIFQPGFSFGIPKILHNRTQLPFISSDNPVCFFSGNRNSKQIVPYNISSSKNFSFVMPISSEMVLVNESFLKRGRMHIEINDRNLVAEINRITAMFSYRYIFARNQSFLNVGKKYRLKCPIPDFDTSIIGDGIVYKIGYKFDKPEMISNDWQYDFVR